MTENTQVFSANLRRYRKQRGLSQADLAASADLSRVGYRNIEAGSSTPRADTLVRLAEALGASLQDLVAPVRKLQGVRFRAKKRINSREDLLIEVGRWLDGYNELEELLQQKRPYLFAELAAQLRAKKTDAVDAAALARETLDLAPDESIRDICGLLESSGIKLYTPSVSTDSFFGLSVGPDGDGPAIVVNTWNRITVERWIFTAAHELGHLLLHHAAFETDETTESAEEEKEADLFASHFLMPDVLFERELEDVRGLTMFDAVMKLKSIFRVSWKTVVYRLNERQGAAGTNMWALFQASAKREYGKALGPKEEPDNLSDGEWRSPSPVLRIGDEPENLRPHAFVEDRLSGLVRLGLEEGRVSMSRGAELLGLSISDMRRLSNSWLV